ncbi:MAG: glycosyltransferase family 2 protein [Planctomycetes bacterium]|nr:glycosyltransferase family 2 protein [Planctomycetota bacterium]MBL7106277.1 glycosyltransferase family 2 protein [Phycisphaerae bacterium]
MTEHPRVTIGLPVHNGQSFIAEAIESVMTQTFTDLELLISDNASTDATPDICREFEKKDKRIKYLRNENNIGAVQNFNNLVALSTGTYFKWLAADNGLKPTFVEKSVILLDNNPEVILVTSKYIQRDEVANSWRFFDYDHDLTALKPVERFRQLLSRKGLVCDRSNLPIWALMRKSQLQKTPLLGSFIGCDDCLLLDLAIRGEFAQLPQRLIILRHHNHAYHSMKAKNNDKEGHAEASWLDSRNPQKTYAPYWRRLTEYLKVIGNSDLNFSDKNKLRIFTLTYFAKKYRMLGSEIIYKIGLGPAYQNTKACIRNIKPQRSRA